MTDSLPPQSIVDDSIANAARASACPGLLRVVPARDGGICRVKLPCGVLQAGQARVVADVAQHYANGIVELTNRANLQIRGVRAESSEALIAALIDAGLGPRAAAGDDVRNVMVSPTFGIDTEQLLDTAPLAARILDALQMQPRFLQLSPKFAVLIDGGERSAALEHHHDLWLSAFIGNKSTGDEMMFAIGVAGCPSSPQTVFAVPRKNAFDLVDATLHTFLDCAHADQSRLRDVLTTMAAPEFFTRVQQRLPFALVPQSNWQRKAAPAFAHVGIHSQRQHDFCYVGAVPPLGRINIEQLPVVADLAQKFGDGNVRLTPRQSVLLPNVPARVADSVAAQLRAAGFAIDRHDPFAQTIACAGSAGCAKSRAETKGDARMLAQLLGRKFVQIEVHLSGCERSCAAAHVAAFTLLAVDAGKYDLHRRSDDTQGFGAVIAASIDIEQAAVLIARHS